VNIDPSDRLVLYVRTRADGDVCYELRDVTLGSVLLLGDIPPSLADYASRGELMVEMLTIEQKNARVKRWRYRGSGRQ